MTCRQDVAQKIARALFLKTGGVDVPLHGCTEEESRDLCEWTRTVFGETTVTLVRGGEGDPSPWALNIQW